MPIGDPIRTPVYLQKLFTARNSTCSDFIYSVRLDHAARLLSRRVSLGTSQPLSKMRTLVGFATIPIFRENFAAVRLPAG